MSDAYTQYEEFMTRAGFSKDQGMLDKPGFLRVWTKYFPWLKTSHNESMPFKCHVCEDLEVSPSRTYTCMTPYSSAAYNLSPASFWQNLIKQNQRDPKRLSVLRLVQYDHLVFQQEERQMYYTRRQQAINQPHLYTSLTIDGMQQRTCLVPRKSKFEYPQTKLNQKLIGVLVHGGYE